MSRAALAVFLLAMSGFAQSRGRVAEYALILPDAPAARAVPTRAALLGAQGRGHVERLRAAQRGVVEEAGRRRFTVTGTSQTLLNAVFVAAEMGRESELRNIAGVVAVVRMPQPKPDLDSAFTLINAAQAQALAPGGAANAGAGVKIAIIDSGIDFTHPAFQDSSLTPPAGFPKGDAAFTNNKIIVARSYVRQIATTSSGAPYEDTSTNHNWPDDLTPRDHVGHGTAIAMIAAGARVTAPLATIQGIAPKAYLGNYKVQGSPGVNFVPNWGYGVVTALTDALNDGMDIAALAYGEGDMPVHAARDIEPFPDGACDVTKGTCDPVAYAIENAVGAGMLVVTAAGNDGDLNRHVALSANLADKFPTLATIHTPGIAPSSLTVGATANSHLLYQTVTAVSPNPPASLAKAKARVGRGPQFLSDLTGTIKDVAQTGDDGTACAALPAGSLSGQIALILRGGCAYVDKLTFAQNAGAKAVILYLAQADDTIPTAWGDGDAGIPAVMVNNADGAALKAWANANAGATVKISPTWQSSSATANVVADFSSRGPATGTLGLKPELVAPGVGIYTATQKIDPNSALYDASGYIAADGTSMSVGFAAGAAALVKQNRPSLRPGQLKSLLVNTASTNVATSTGSTRMVEIGAGRLDAQAAMNGLVTFEPAALSFGAITSSSLPASLTLTVSNAAGTPQAVALSVQPSVSASAAITLNTTSFNLAPGQSLPVTARLAGTAPSAGSYEGAIVATVNGVTYRVPYLFLVASNTISNVFPVRGAGFLNSIQGTWNEMALKAIDQSGVPVVSANPGTPNPSVTWSILKGNGAFSTSVDNGITYTMKDDRTFAHGLAYCYLNIKNTPGEQLVRATVAGVYTVDFEGWALESWPLIGAGGVVEAATSKPLQGVTPGSYISIYGSYLAPTFLAAYTPDLPLSLARVSVAFYSDTDAMPGRVYFVSPGQINVQVPWELQGQTTARMVVKIYDVVSDIYTLTLAPASPGVFSNGAAILDYPGYNVVSASNPAARGSVIQLFANGLGPVDHAQVTGEPAVYPPLVNTVSTPGVTIGGRPAHVEWSGLAPGFVGLYQVNVTVPADTPTGKQQLVMSAGGVTGAATDIYIE